MLRASELRQKSREELLKVIDDLEEAQYNLRFRKVTDVEENPSEYKTTRRDIARVKTILREQELAAARTSTTTEAS